MKKKKYVKPELISRGKIKEITLQASYGLGQFASPN
jgi:hypothetical protein